MTRRQWILGIALMMGLVDARAELRSIGEDEAQVASWNRFVDVLHALQQKQLAGKDVRQEEEIDGYPGFPRFYREVTYRDRAADRTLSIVRFVRERPTQIHSISVFIHDENGVLVRDYSATYLPWARNAPIQTLVRFYDHPAGLEAFRVFDASGNFLYEDCKGTLAGRRIELGLDEFDRIQAERVRGSVLASTAYKTCFAGLPSKPGKYVDPQ